jgi:uncharacterized membrane protein YqaE (UPF0057 family)
MRLIIAILLPFLVFFTIGRPIAGIICLILQITLIGWLPAAIWAVYALGQSFRSKPLQPKSTACSRLPLRFSQRLASSVFGQSCSHSAQKAGLWFISSRCATSWAAR